MSPLDIDIVSLIDIIALVQGVFIGLLLLFRKKHSLPSLLIGLFLIFNCVELIPAILLNTEMILNHPRLLFLPSNFYYLSIPLLYLYTQSIISKIDWKKSIYHLIPGILEFLILGFLFIIDPSDGGQRDISETTMGIMSAYFIVGVAYSMYYMILTIRLAQKHKDKILNYISSTENYLLMWIKQGSIAYLILLIFISLLYIFESNSFFTLILVSLFNAAIIYWFSYKALMQRFIKVSRMKESEVNEDNLFKKEIDKEHYESQKQEEYIEEVVPQEKGLTLEKLTSYIDSSRCYLQTNLTIFDVAIGLDTSIRDVSNVINNEAHLKFNSFINRFRVEKSKLLLLDKKYANLSIEGIGIEVGFKSKSAFYRAFKHFENMTPGQFNPNK